MIFALINDNKNRKPQILANLRLLYLECYWDYPLTFFMCAMSSRTLLE